VIDEAEFAQHVKDALDRYYDPARLQLNPLGRLLLPHEQTADEPNRALRKLLIGTIDQLRPEDTVSYGDVEWLPYRVLWCRHIEGQEIDVICGELSISRSNYYRHYRAALAAIVSMLWNRYQDRRRQAKDRPALAEERPSDAPDALITREALRVSRASSMRLIDLSRLVEEVVHTVRPLLDQHGAELVFSAPVTDQWAYGDQAVFHQIIVNILAEGIPSATGRLTLDVKVVEQGTEWVLRGLDICEMDAKGDGGIPGFHAGQALLAACGGHLWVETDPVQHVALHFLVPNAPSTEVLIIDNDEDALALYRRYLPARAYSLRQAMNGEQALAAIVARKPDVILLDLLLPGQDGWSLLRELKADSDMASIAVIICSVLDQPELAFALGAADVLQKPISREALITALRQVRAADAAGD